MCSFIIPAVCQWTTSAYKSDSNISEHCGHLKEKQITLVKPILSMYP